MKRALRGETIVLLYNQTLPWEPILLRSTVNQRKTFTSIVGFYDVAGQNGFLSNFNSWLTMTGCYFDRADLHNCTSHIAL